MNKTITINLAGINFYIDEDAYIKLDKYLKAISVSLDPESRQETMQDIEARIAELFLERQKDKTQVIEMPVVDEMIEIMGQPEDYQIDEEEAGTGSKPHKATTPKKLYRDIDSRVLGGVCSGLGHYVGMSKIWVRIIFLLLFIPGFTSTTFLPSGSTVFLVYIILWIVVPAARTTSEKLEMQGKKIDIDNIERKVKEEYANLKNKVGNANYSGAKSFFEKLGNFLLAVLKVIAIIIGILIVFVAGVSLIAIILSFVTLGAISIGGFDPINSTMGIYTHLPQWLAYLLILLLSGIPFILLLLAGLKIISPRSKPIRLTGILVLIGIWILALVPLLIYGANWNALDTSYLNETETQELTISQSDTLYIQPFSSNRIIADRSSKLPPKEDRITSTAVKFDLAQADNGDAQMEMKKSLKGHSFNGVSARDLVYKTDFKNDTLYLDDKIAMVIDKINIDYQRLNSTLYIPEGTIFSVDKNLSRLFKNLPDQYFGHYLHFKDGELQCPDCESHNHNKDNKEKKTSSSESEWYQEQGNDTVKSPKTTEL